MSAIAGDRAGATFDARAALAPARRQIGLRQAAGWAIRGLLAGAILAILILAADRILTIPAAIPLAIGALVVGSLGGLIAGLRRWPDELRAARIVDGHFELRDRVTTALELRGANFPLAQLQRADAGRRLEGLRLTESARGLVSGREAGGAALAVILVIVLALFGVPASHGRAQSSSSDQLRYHRVAQSQVPKIVRSVTQGLTPAARHDAAIRNLNLALQRLRLQLQHAPNRAAALRAISATQQELHRIAGSLHPIKPAAVSQLNRALSSRMTAQQRALLRSGNNRQALKAAAATLNRLAQQLGHMTAAQKAALARQLAQAANNTKDSTLRSALQRAASSLAYNDPQSAASALQQAAAALDRTPSAEAAQASLSSANGQLESLKGQVSGLSNQPGSSGSSGSQSPGSATGGQGNGKGNGPGQGSGKGAGKGNGSGSGKGTGKGSGSGQGKGSGAGQGKGTGQGQGQGTGRGNGGSGGSGGTGGHGIGGGRGGAGNHGTGHSGARVYVPPVKVGKGNHTIQSGGPNGAPLQGSTVPYQQVIGQYEQTARTALDRGSLPPSLQSYVRQYFSSISH